MISTVITKSIGGILNRLYQRTPASATRSRVLVDASQQFYNCRFNGAFRNLIMFGSSRQRDGNLCNERMESEPTKNTMVPSNHFVPLFR